MRSLEPARSATRSNARLTGQIHFVDNLSENLEPAAGDALYADALFIMLAVPGALLALGLAYLAALGTVDRDRRELALIRPAAPPPSTLPSRPPRGRRDRPARRPARPRVAFGRSS